jgi:hypothetical protein
MHQQYITQVCSLQVAPVIYNTVCLLKVTPVAYKIVCCLKVVPVIHGIVNVLVLAKCNMLLILQCIIDFAFLNNAHYNIVRLHLSLCDVKAYAGGNTFNCRKTSDSLQHAVRYYVILRIQLPI